MSRQNDLDRFYSLLDDLEQRVGGKRRLKNCDGYMDWPERGVYFFFEPGETRKSTDQLRVTRVGTHATTTGSSQSLWDRLKQHYGTGSGSDDHPHGGDHRSSVYRKEVGQAFIEKFALQAEYPDWDIDRIKNADRARGPIRDEEYPLERRVSTYLREQPFLWVRVDDEPGRDSDRESLERHSIALLSNYNSEPYDSRKECWLGKYSPQEKIRKSGLWNNNHVEKDYDPAMLDTFEQYIESTPAL
jgi:hypothetical protein